MSYDKQTWVKYDELKTEEENIQNGAVVTDDHMNHIEEGISANDSAITAHVYNKTNPHTVTASQVGAYSKTETDTKLATKTEDADVVHITGDERIAGNKTFTDDIRMKDLEVTGKVSDLGTANFSVHTTTWSSNGINIAFTRIGPLVIGIWGGAQSNVDQGFAYENHVPSGYRPSTKAKTIVLQNNPSNFNIEADGSVEYQGVLATAGDLAGSFAYFTNDPFPTANPSPALDTEDDSTPQDSQG